MKRWTGLLAAAVAVLVAPLAIYAAPIPITTCGGTIPAGQRGVLQNDVVCDYRCSGDPSVVCGYNGDSLCKGKGWCAPDQFVLEKGATLDLDGHTINLAYQASAAVCGYSITDRGRCTVKGPGVLDGAKGTAVDGASMNVVVKNLTIGSCDTAIRTRGDLRVESVTILDDRENTIFAGGNLRMRRSVISGDGGASAEGDVFLDAVEVVRSGIAAGGMLRGRDVLLDVSGVSAGDVVLRRATVIAPEHRAYLPQITAERRLRLVDSDVVAVASGRAPVLVRSSCDASRRLDDTTSWGVCTDD